MNKNNVIDILNLEPTKIVRSIKGKHFLLFGENGTRKTSVAARFPKPLFIATENGTKFISGLHQVRVTTWSELLKIKAQLKKPEAMEKYETIVFDTSSAFLEILVRYVIGTYCNAGAESLQDAAWGGGYEGLKKELKDFLDGIDALGYGMVFIAYDKDTIDQEDKKKEVVKLDMIKTSSKILKRLADFVLNLRKEEVDGEDTVIAYAGLKGGSDTKQRARFFPKTFEFTYENLERELLAAIDKQVEFEGITAAAYERNIVQNLPFEDMKQNVIALFTKLQEENTEIFQDCIEFASSILPGKSVSKLMENDRDNLSLLEAYIITKMGE